MQKKPSDFIIAIAAITSISGVAQAYFRIGMPIVQSAPTVADEAIKAATHS